MTKLRTLALVSLAALSAAVVSACKPAETTNTADNTTAAADNSTPPATETTNDMSSNAMDNSMSNMATNSPS